MPRAFVASLTLALLAAAGGVSGQETSGTAGCVDSGKTLVLVNTALNRLYVTRSEGIVLSAACSTGKGSSLTTGDETHHFVTPRGTFLIQSKEEGPVWVPPDWYFVEEARKRGLRTVRLTPGRPLDLEPGATGLLRASRAMGAPPTHRLEVRGGTVVEAAGISARPLPAGRLIRAGGAIVIPPYGTPQRRFRKVLGACRIDFGGGFAIHGTDEPGKLGRSVTHGCIRLSDADIRAVYSLVNVGDEIIIF